MAEAKIKLQVVNNQTTERLLMLEPWTSEYRISAGGVYEIVLTGDVDLPLRIELTPEGVTVCAFDSEGATMAILQNGKPASQV